MHDKLAPELCLGGTHGRRHTASPGVEIKDGRHQQAGCEGEEIQTPHRAPTREGTPSTIHMHGRYGDEGNERQKQNLVLTPRVVSMWWRGVSYSKIM